MNIKLLLLPLFLWGLYHFTSSFCDRQTDRFSVARIHSTLRYNPNWDIAPLCEEKQKELEAILSQQFHYLACGGQCFAFGSEDGKYVIKFFKHRIRKPYSYFANIPLPEILDQRRRRKFEKAQYKLNRDFTSYKLAYEELQKETGIIFIHLNKGTSLKRSVTIIDKIGIKHLISLDGIEFVIQKQGKLAPNYFDELMVSRSTECARLALRSMLHTIVSRCKKGLLDEDPRIYRNFGFVGNNAFIIDVGRFIRDDSRKDPAIYHADLLHITHRFRKWLVKTHPKLVNILDEELHALQAQS